MTDKEQFAYNEGRDLGRKEVLHKLILAEDLDFGDSTPNQVLKKLVDLIGEGLEEIK